MVNANADAGVMAGIEDVARTHLGWTGPLSRDLPLVETFGLDSVRQLTLLMEIENRFRVRLDDEDEASLNTVGDLLDVIGRRLAEPAPDNR
jgi:acyl carrier protein